MTENTETSQNAVSGAPNTVFLVNKTGGVIAGAVIHSVGFVITPFLPEPTLEARFLGDGESASGETIVSHNSLDYWLVPIAINAGNDFFILPSNTGFRPYKECSAANDGKTYIEIEASRDGGRTYPVTIRALNPNGSNHTTCHGALDPLAKYLQDNNEFTLSILHLLEALIG